MKYKVQANVLPADKTQGEHIVQARTVSGWVEAGSPLDAAAEFVLDNPDVRQLYTHRANCAIDIGKVRRAA